MKNKYYKKQLEFLTRVGREFAKAHPSTAGLLGQTDNDPDVMRLLEGFSYLTGKIWERAEADVPYLAQTICEMMFPHCALTTPSCSIIQFSPSPSTLARPMVVPKGVELRANPVEPVEKTSCEFRTTMQVELLPLEVEECTMTNSSGFWTLTLRMNHWGEPGEVFPNKRLRLYLHGEFAVTTMLWLWLANYCRQIDVSVVGQAKSYLTYGPEIVVPAGMHPDEALLPWPRMALEGFRYLQEYFAFPKKLLFVDLKLDRPLVASPGKKVEIYFVFVRPPELPGRVTRDILRLHCSPVINLFKANAEPIRHELPGEEHLVRYGVLAPEHCEVYSVDKVEGANPRGEEPPAKYPRFMSRDFCRGGGKMPFFHVRRAPCALGRGFDTYLSVNTVRGVVPDLREDVLLSEITCTNRDLARELRVGDICRHAYVMPWQDIPFKNIMGVSPATPAQFGRELFWDLLVYMGVSQCSLTDLENFRALLRMNDLQSLDDDPRGIGNRRRIDSIKSMQSKEVIYRYLAGVKSTINMDESVFASKGEAFLFGRVLDEFFGSRVPINSFHETNIVLQPSRTEFNWLPRNGWAFLQPG